MRKNILIIIIVFSSLVSTGQSFCLSDSQFQIGDTLRKTIYFDINAWRIMPESTRFLDTLAIMLTEHDSIIVRIESNTDYRGNNDYNDSLSDRRAKSVVYYLVDKGINSERLTAIGMGEKAPIIKEEEILALPTREEQEKAHAINRQTVFRIIGFRK